MKRTLQIPHGIGVEASQVQFRMHKRRTYLLPVPLAFLLHQAGARQSHEAEVADHGDHLRPHFQEVVHDGYPTCCSCAMHGESRALNVRYCVSGGDGGDENSEQESDEMSLNSLAQGCPRALCCLSGAR